MASKPHSVQELERQAREGIRKGCFYARPLYDQRADKALTSLVEQHEALQRELTEALAAGEAAGEFMTEQHRRTIEQLGAQRSVLEKIVREADSSLEVLPPTNTDTAYFDGRREAALEALAASNPATSPKERVKAATNRLRELGESYPDVPDPASRPPADATPFDKPKMQQIGVSNQDSAPASRQDNTSL